ncbi:hypothetical protein B0H15DRAFT_796257 [Mycena belliarum]|uniref:Uncharacterized protein n=1 Tax=Mycena belliarum TaxID=1033014 RepID=A0AAD6XWR6_9AGAR|nr:hypothetical protein B0H15DRAFT_796257 [Mycena belliae]
MSHIASDYELLPRFSAMQAYPRVPYPSPSKNTQAAAGQLFDPALPGMFLDDDQLFEAFIAIPLEDEPQRELGLSPDASPWPSPSPPALSPSTSLSTESDASSSDEEPYQPSYDASPQVAAASSSTELDALAPYEDAYQISYDASPQLAESSSVPPDSFYALSSDALSYMLQLVANNPGGTEEPSHTSRLYLDPKELLLHRPAENDADAVESVVEAEAETEPLVSSTVTLPKSFTHTPPAHTPLASSFAFNKVSKLAAREVGDDALSTCSSGESEVESPESESEYEDARTNTRKRARATKPQPKSKASTAAGAKRRAAGPSKRQKTARTQPTASSSTSENSTPEEKDVDVPQFIRQNGEYPCPWPGCNHRPYKDRTGVSRHYDEFHLHHKEICRLCGTPITPRNSQLERHWKNANSCTGSAAKRKEEIEKLNIKPRPRS